MSHFRAAALGSSRGRGPETGWMIGRLDPSQYKRKKGDAVIAATVEVEGEPVVTRNVEGFERHGVPVESY